MAFFENLGKKVGEAAQAAAKKSSELVETTKLNASIGSETDKIQKLYNQIGKLVYEKYAETGEADENIAAACAEIAEHELNIKELRKKIAEIKGVKQCAGCGAEMERNQVFCSKCGARNEVPAPAAGEETPPAQQPAASFCPSCGSALESGAAFCPNCGSKVE
jgi:DNA replicative helicase MCM subunit Mcm2 (Cdc46/Mcm family)